MTSMNVYSKEQIDAKIPATTGATIGDVLTVGASGTEWATPSGGVTITDITTRQQLMNWILNAKAGDVLALDVLSTQNSNTSARIRFATLTFVERADYSPSESRYIYYFSANGVYSSNNTNYYLSAIAIYMTSNTSITKTYIYGGLNFDGTFVNEVTGKGCKY